MTTKQEVLRAHLKEWLATQKYSKERKRLKERLAQTVRMHPNSIPRAMRRFQLTSRSTTERRGRPRRYTQEAETALYEIWKAMDTPCAEVLHPMIDVYIQSFVSNKRWTYGSEIEALVKGMSIGSIKLRIAKWRVKEGITRGYSTTRTSPLKEMIPIRKSHTWTGSPPGHLQMDTVVHCGDLLTGDVVYSLGGVDFATYWHEYTAQWNKGKEATLESIKHILARFPFGINEIHPDTGDEFINYHVKRWCDDPMNSIAITRSEPYKKNDNMCIEERNNTLARRHLGYARLDDVSCVALAATILEKASLIHNHFRPVRRMTNKVRIGAKWKRTFEKVALTPYQRVLESEHIADVMKQKLQQEHEVLDPLTLQKELATLKETLAKKLTRNDWRS
jgi:hypothetical protein